MKKLTLNPEAKRAICNGICLLDRNHFSDLQLTDGWAHLYDKDGTFLALAYFSKQHKGIGWVVSKQPITIDQSFFESLFLKAWEKRQIYHQSGHTTAYRIFNQDGDGFGGLTVDYYQGQLVFSWYNSFVYSLRDQIITAARAVLPDIVAAYEKIRFQGLAFESRQIFGPAGIDRLVIKENGVAFDVFLNDGLMTGIFLDQHEIRGLLVDGLASGKSVLNMFSYTAAFSVAAAMGGARATTSVDLAKRSRDLSRAHFEANQLDVSDHQFVVMDVFEYFKYAKRHQMRFDLIILDPPSFARNKKQTFSVAKDYHLLVSQSLDLLAEGGTIIASTNASNVTLEKFKQQIEKGFGKQKPVYFGTYRLPDDFQINKKDESSNYLKVVIIRA
ncbi:class I SAM-dependent rRNA methyltransferase [Streptococcus ovuberis]|uniref:Class I SAM-dependent rRNA methyltransferase n=1 Tax=Streptococcus ovuberis TaxID=1936207 RepID=A0A7X6MZL0_9STRE|nr:class I SAM-dependent rRNA methyltransferase [Streptococcus ovuberis]NKZ20766.1 class I SAM-dependent rRNA methyltransferase [Streptococcus ovuberis]